MAKLSVKQFEVEQNNNMILLYGDSGVGKTTTAVTSINRPDIMGEVLVLDSDGGLSVIGERHAQVIDVFGTETLTLALTELTLPRERRRPELREIGTIVIDSLSSLRDVGLEETALENARKGQRTDQYVQQLQDWNRVLNIIRSFLRQIRQTDYRVIAIAGERQSEAGGIVSRVEPNLNQALANSVTYIFGCIWRVTKSSKSLNRSLQIMDNPTMQDRMLHKTRASKEALHALSTIVDKDGRFIVPNFLELDQEFATIPFLYEVMVRPEHLTELINEYQYKI